MKINRKLNLVLEVERGDGTLVHVHHTPIPEEVYNEHWEVIVDAVSGAYMRNWLPPAAVRVGTKMLIKSAEKFGRRKHVEEDLLPNIWRMTNVILSTPDGFKPTPLDVVTASGQGLDEEDIEEVKQYIAFFTSASWVHPRKELEPLLYQMLRESGARFTSQNSTEYATSLLTSKQEDSTGEKKTAAVFAPPH